MRLRNIPGAEEAVATSKFCLPADQPIPGQWAQVFGNNNPVRIEIGMGKGRFIMDQAALNPDINYIGVEKYASVLLRALEKMEVNPLPNIRFLCINAESITDWFTPGELDLIYLNFSDPWPKDRHAKRRLTSQEFLKRYDQILKKDGQLEFKTDNQDLFTFSLEQVEPAGWQLIASTRDLHHDEELVQGNVMTEYEEKFSSQGNPICKMIICR